MLPKEIIDVFETYDEEDYSLLATQAGLADDGFYLKFTLHLQAITDTENSTQKWTVKASEYRKSQVSFDVADFLTVSQQSALLWEFTDIQSELYFSGQIKEPARLFFDLYKVHKNFFENYQSFDLPFIEERLYAASVSYSNGFLAKGPRKLLEHYSNCLKQNGLDFSIVGERRLTIWNGFKHVPESQDLKVLFLGDTYIIAEKFVFEPQE